MRFENGIMNEPISDRRENMKRYRVLAKQLEKLPSAEQAEVLRWLERYKTDVQRNPALYLEATEIVMGMIAESRPKDALPKERKGPQSEIDPVLLNQRWKEFELELKYEGLEIAHENLTDEELLADKKGDGEVSAYESHGKHGRK